MFRGAEKDVARPTERQTPRMEAVRIKAATMTSLRRAGIPLMRVPPRVEELKLMTMMWREMAALSAKHG